MTWTREHNKIIAERCEGLTVVDIDGHYFTPATADGVPFHDYHGGPAILSRYNTEIISCVRAADTWRKQDHWRQLEIRSPLQSGNKWQARVWSYRQLLHDATGDTAAEALAWALYNAVS